MKKRIAIISLLLLLLLSAVAVAQRPMDEQAKLRFAATQHEIISILIEEGEFDRVLPEFRKIVNLGLQDERLVVQEVGVVTNGLMVLDAFSTAHQIIDEFLPLAKERENQFTLLMIKGKVFKQEGRLKDAVKMYRQAQELND
ncbi:MAG: hypothetical protein JSU96_17805 [Acidobacteriota bacterium]|nr:MAG: hypothetical protein JSU96_17805 [Acidobacteriota bacterium]